MKRTNVRILLLSDSYGGLAHFSQESRFEANDLWAGDCDTGDYFVDSDESNYRLDQRESRYP